MPKNFLIIFLYFKKIINWEIWGEADVFWFLNSWYTPCIYIMYMAVDWFLYPCKNNALSVVIDKLMYFHGEYEGLFFFSILQLVA